MTKQLFSCYADLELLQVVKVALAWLVKEADRVDEVKQYAPYLKPGAQLQIVEQTMQQLVEVVGGRSSRHADNEDGPQGRFGRLRLGKRILIEKYGLRPSSI
jgi:hypothetical protein